MKVLHVIPSLSPLRGGPIFTLAGMAQALTSAGIEVHVATTDDNGPGRLSDVLGDPSEENGVVYHYFRRQTRFYTASWPLTKWLARHTVDYDLVHIHSLFSYAAIPAALFAWRAGIPYIVRPLGTLNRWGMTKRRPWLKQLSFRLLERHILQGTAAVHYTSDQERLEASSLNFDHNPVVIAPGIDLQPFEDYSHSSWLRDRAPHLNDRTIVIFLSRLDRKKGLDLLLPAVAALRAQQPKIALVLAGDGDPDYVQQLRHEATRLGINEDVYWTGFVTGDEKLAVLGAADLFVLPSYSENFGVAVVEALAAGLPVVVSDQVAIATDIASAQAGLVVPCCVKDLSQALERLISDAELRHMMGTCARRLAHERFSLEAMTQGLVTLYESILLQERRG